MLNKTLSIIDIFLDCIAWNKDPESKELNEKLDKLVNTIEVRERISTREKRAAIFDILTNIEDDDRPDRLAVNVELQFTLQVISYYTNIDVPKHVINISIFNEDLYDILLTSGVLVNLAENAGNDIELFRKLLDDSINWRNIIDLSNTFGQMDTQSIEELSNQLNNLKDGLDDRTIQMIDNITKMNNPSQEEISAMISNEFVDIINKTEKEKIERFKEKYTTRPDMKQLFNDQAYIEITNNIKKYYEEHSENGKYNEEDVKDVYDYLANRSMEDMNDITVSIDQESVKVLRQGMTEQMIKLLDKKQELQNKYNKNQELIRLADKLMSANSNNTDAIRNYLETLKNEQK